MLIGGSVKSPNPPRRTLYSAMAMPVVGAEKMTHRTLPERTLFPSQREKCREIDE
jgi:hypothetical protein